MRKSLFILGLVLLLFISCSQNPVKDVCIPLKSTIENNTRPENIDILDNIGIIPLETTDESLLGECQIVDVNNKEVIIKDLNSIYIFNKETGKYESKILRLGDGPEEYASLSDVVSDSSRQQVYVLDGNGNVKVYDSNGKFRKKYENDSIISMEMLNNSHFVAFNRPNGPYKYDINIYDNEWSVLKNLHKKHAEKPHYKDIIEINDFCIFNGLPCFMESDTIYQIKDGNINFLFYIDKGDLALPMEVFTDIKRKKERASYIWGNYGFLAGDFYFLRFYYDNKIYYDIWNISSMKLMCRNVVSSPIEPKGVPVYINGKEIYVWPSFVKNDTVYCILMDTEVEKINFPNNNEGNPIIFVGRIKSI